MKLRVKSWRDFQIVNLQADLIALLEGQALKLKSDMIVKKTCDIAAGGIYCYKGQSPDLVEADGSN